MTQTKRTSEISGREGHPPSMHGGVVTRFAPSPTGFLHLGHAHSALFAYQTAMEAGGRFLLRIEDIDTTRSRPEFVAAIEEDLAWQGLQWESPVRIQSQHMNLYAHALHTLEEAGLTYPCFCTRKDIQAEIEASPSAPHGPDGPVYPGLCKAIPETETRRRIESGEPHAIRIHMDKAARITGPLTFFDRGLGKQDVEPETCGDVVLARKDIATSYHMAVTVDDALQHVTCVTRGMDLLHATHIHRILQALLGLPEPEYHHHGLLTDESGKRYAKRDKAVSIRELRMDRGLSPEEVRRLAGFPDFFRQ